MILINNILTGCMIAALALAGPAKSATVGNGPPNQTGGSDLNGFLEADDFTIGGAVSVTQVQYWSLQDDETSYAGTTDWSINSDSAGLPGAIVASGNTAATGVATGNTTFGLNEYAYSFSVSVPLNPGTYWLVLHNGPSNAQPQTDYYWAWSADSGNSQSQDLSVQPAWAGNFSELAFLLTTSGTSSATPEPGSAGLLGCGLVAAWLARRRMNSGV